MVVARNEYGGYKNCGIKCEENNEHKKRKDIEKHNVLSFRKHLLYNFYLHTGLNHLPV